MIEKRLRSGVAIIAILLMSSSPLLAQVMQRRIPMPAPTTSAPAPAADSQAAAVAPAAAVPDGCPKDYAGPPLISAVEPLAGSWQNNIITPLAFDPSNPDSYSYHFFIKGCGLRSDDPAQREQIGFDLGQGLTLIDDGVGSDIYHANYQLLYAPGAFVQDALRTVKAPIGPFRIIVVTPLGRAQTEQIYMIAPVAKRAARDMIAFSEQRAAAINLACVHDARPRLLRVGEKPGAVQFSNVGRWRLHGCAFGPAAGNVQLISRSGVHIATRVVSWSEQVIEIATDDYSATTSDQVAVAVSIEPPQAIRIASPNIHQYRVFTPMPQGWKAP